MSDRLTPEPASARVKAAELSFWSTAVEPEPLGGGITNTNFVVSDGGEKFVVRIGDDLPLHGVLRRQEVKTARAAFAAGLSPEIVHHEPGALVMRFIDARTLTADDVRDPDTLGRIVELVRRCHLDMASNLRGATLIFWVFQVCRNYLAIAAEGNCRVASRLDGLAAMNEVLERRLGPIQPAFCHNDLLPANFLDDGDRLWLLDWEYAGWNTPIFDLGNLASNAELPSEQKRWLLETYFGRAPDHGELIKLDVAACASLLREALWSVVQEQHSSLDFDFEAYTDDQLTRLDAAYAPLDSST